MAKDISRIKQEIYDFAKNYDFYKNNSFIAACFKLTCAVEDSFLNLLLYGTLSLQFGSIPNLQDKFRGAYREALKNAYRFCKSSTGKDESEIDNSELETVCKILTEYFSFNEIRNLFEQTQLGKYTVQINSDNEITFIRNISKRSINSELYARWANNEKPESELKKASNIAEKELYRYMVDPKCCKFWDITDPTLSTLSQFKKVYNFALEKVKSDSEELDNYDFGEFNTEEFHKVYAVLVAMSVTIINYHFVSRLMRKIEINRNKPIAIIKYPQLIDLAQKSTGLSNKKVKSVIETIIYNPQIHTDKITIYQPLFRLDDIIFFSPSIIYYSITYEKLLYLAKSSTELQPMISKLAKEREGIMLSDLCDYIDTNSQLLYLSNFIIKDANKPVAEFDLILYDEVNKKMLLTELKWFFSGDGEFDYAKIDRKIESAISDRIKKEAIAKKHLKEIQEELNIQEDSNIEIKSCIVSKNFSGSDFIDDDLAVFDEFLFKLLLEQTEFNLSKVFEKLKDKSYLPDMNSVGYCYVSRTVECSGYKINFEGLAHTE